MKKHVQADLFGMSPSLVVMGEDSYSRGLVFKSYARYWMDTEKPSHLVTLFTGLREYPRGTYFIRTRSSIGSDKSFRDNNSPHVSTSHCPFK